MMVYLTQGLQIIYSSKGFIIRLGYSRDKVEPKSARDVFELLLYLMNASTATDFQRIWKDVTFKFLFL